MMKPLLLLLYYAVLLENIKFFHRFLNTIVCILILLALAVINNR